MLARALLIITLAASSSSCGGHRVPSNVTASSHATPWFCQAKDRETWDCVQDAELAARPAPAAPTPPTTPHEPEPQPVTKGSDPSVTVRDERPAYQSLAFEPDQPMKLTDLPPDYYAVQVVALKSQRAVEKWVKERGLTHMSVARIAKDDEILFVVLLGVYPDRASAERAVDERPPPLRDVTPWVRKLSSLQAAIRAAPPAED
jgi:septal ring-binding cell division protein DamX